MKRAARKKVTKRRHGHEISLETPKHARFTVMASLEKPVLYELVSVAVLAEELARQMRMFGARRRWLLSDHVGPAGRRSAEVPSMKNIPDLPEAAVPLERLMALTNAVLRSEQVLIRDARRLKEFLDINPEFRRTLMSWGHPRQVMVTCVLFAADAVGIELSALQVAAIVGQVGERPDSMEFGRNARKRTRGTSTTMYKMRRKLLPVLKKTRWLVLQEGGSTKPQGRSVRAKGEAQRQI